MGYLTVKDVSIEKISFDYSSYGDAQLSEGDFGHVTEIYDFSPSLKTEHLLEVFSDFQWVPLWEPEHVRGAKGAVFRLERAAESDEFWILVLPLCPYVLHPSCALKDTFLQFMMI